MILFDETLTLITLIAGYLCLGSIVVLGISDRPAVQRVPDTRALAVDGGACALIVVSMLLISWIAIPYWIAAAISKITKPGFWNWSIRHTKQLWIMVGVMFLLQLTIVGLCYQKESYWSDYYRYDYPAYDAVDSVAVDVEETTVDSVAPWSEYYYDTYPDTAAYKY